MEKAEFETLARTLRPKFVAIARQIVGNDDDADDAVQETLLKLWFFRQRLADYSSPEAPATLILKRVCISMLRSRKPTDDIDSAAELTVSPYEPADEALAAAIESLPAMEQAVLRMKHIDGMETAEIADLVGSNPAAVRTALSRARKKVRDIYLTLSQPRL